MKRSWTLGQPSGPNRISAPFATGAESSNAACARTASGVCRSIRAKTAEDNEKSFAERREAVGRPSTAWILGKAPANLGLLGRLSMRYTTFG